MTLFDEERVVLLLLMFLLNEETDRLLLSKITNHLQNKPTKQRHIAGGSDKLTPINSLTRKLE